MGQTVLNESPSAWSRVLHAPSLTIARLVLASYLRSGWVWGEAVLVLACFAALYFPFKESTAYFNGTTFFCLGALAILGPSIMVRQATGARVYLILARVTSRASYSRGLMLAAAVLRLPLYLLFLALVLVFHRLVDTSVNLILWGLLGNLPPLMLIAVVTVALCPPIATRRQRILFLAWVALVLFTYKPLIPMPSWLNAILSLSQLPLWPLFHCYTLSYLGTFNLFSVISLLLLVVYVALISWIAGRWLDRRDLLLH